MDIVMPAWMAGIQGYRMRPETSMSAWNDTNRGVKQA